MKTKTTKAKPTVSSRAKSRDLSKSGSLSELKTKIMEIRLSIKAHQEKNTNAHKAMKKQIAQLLTSAKGGSASGGKTQL